MELYFEGRAVKPYGEYVLSTDLIVGQVYFKVGFLDEDAAVPEMYALVFIGKNLHPNLPGMYFQDVESYFGGARRQEDAYVPSYEAEFPDGCRWEDDECQFEWQKDRERSGVFTFDGALNSLLHCSIGRKRWDGIVRRPKFEP